MTLRLVIEHSPVPQPRAELRHEGGELTIGRGADCDWRIEDPEQLVSRRHCVISGGAGRWTVTDMSSGGLYVDGAGRPLGPGNSAPVENGTRLRLGDVLLRAEVGEAQAAASASPAKTPEADDFFARRDPAPPPPPRPESLPPRFDGESRPFEAPSKSARVDAPPLFDDPFTLGTADLRPREAGVREPDAAGRAGGGALSGPGNPFGFGAAFGPSSDPTPAPHDAGGRARANTGTEDDWGFGLSTAGGPGRSGSGAAGSGADAPVAATDDPFGDWGLGGLSNGGAGGQGDRSKGQGSGAGGPTARDTAADDPFGLGTGDRVRVRNPDAADPRHANEDERKRSGSAPGVAEEAPQQATADTRPTGHDAEVASVAATASHPGGIHPPALPGATGIGAAKGGTGSTADLRIATDPGPGPVVGGQSALPPPDPGDAARLDAFLRGAGLDRAQPLAADEMEALGRRFRAMAEGLILLLRTRAQEKNSVRVAQTVFGARDVNPLKFAATPEEGVAALVAHRGKGYLDPDAAIEAALRDLTDHQMRTWTGLQTALRRMIDRFDPGLFEAEIEDVGMLKSLISGGRAARLWQLYTERYRDIATAAEGRFLGEVGADFRDAYEGSKGDGS